MQEPWHERYCPEPNSGCWLWFGRVNKRGYGRIWIAGRETYVHRAMWERSRHQALPAGWVVCHKCDNPACINPDHLFLGTRADNLQDMWKKGRGSKPPRHDFRGERCWAHKLTEEDIRAIRRSDELQRVLAERYGVRQNTISRIKSGKRWSHI